MKKLKVAVGLSGGVDSAVSAYLLKKQGFDVSGVYLHCFDEDIPGCRSQQDRQDALKVAVHLKIPFRVLDFRRQYKSSVIDYFKKEYLAGRTPNPDVICNRDIKFGLLLDWCIKNRFDYLATGHYADGPRFLPEQKSVGTPAPANDRSMSRASNEGKANAKTWLGATPILRIPKDLHKDQTYFLWAVPRQKFRRVLFPLANYLKSEVRAMASRLAPLSGVANKPDSTGICFVGEVRVEDFLKRLRVKEKIGEVVTTSGQLIGRHRGVWFYTIGQRHGFEVTRWPPRHPEQSEAESRDLAAGDKNIASLDSSTSSLRSVARNDGVTDRPPLYVIAKDVRRNRLVVGFGPETYRDNFQVSDCNWLAPELTYQRINASTHCFVRIRHLGDLIPCQLSVVGCRLSVVLRFAQRGVAPGQSAVFYSEDGIVLGGGVIQ